MTRGLTHSLAAKVHDVAASVLPADALALARRGLIDCIAVTFAGWDAPVARHLRRTEAPHWADPLADPNLSKPREAMHLAVAAHALDFDDTALSGHPSAVLVPAILAELRRTPTPGHRALSAWIAGYEVWAELETRLPEPLHAAGWHPSAIFGPPAAAAAVASLRGLSLDRIATAMSLAASMTGGVTAQFGSWAKPWQLARAAESGHIAADLAEAGMQAAPDALEHPAGGLLAALAGARRARLDGECAPDLLLLTHGLNVKLYPVCYAMHRVLDAAGALRRDHAPDPAQIESVTVEIGATQAAILRHDRPNTVAEARFSLLFGVASMLLKGACGLCELDETFIRSASVQRLLPRIKTELLTERSQAEPAHSPWDRVTLHMADGTALRSDQIAFPLGHFRNPAPEEALRTKFADCLRVAEREAKAKTLFDRFSGIVGIDDCRSLFEEGRHAQAD